MDWQPMQTAPRDGTAIQARIPGHGSDNIIAWDDGLVSSGGGFCGGWQFVEDQEPPDDWTDGICWAVNADGKASTQPSEWKPRTAYADHVGAGIKIAANALPAPPSDHVGGR